MEKNSVHYPRGTAEQIRKNAEALDFDPNSIVFLDLSPNSKFFAEVQTYDTFFSPAEVEREPTTEIITEVVALKPQRIFLEGEAL